MKAFSVETRPHRNFESSDRSMNRRVSTMEREPAYPYTDIDIRVGAYREVIITKISNPNSFYVRITEFEDELKKLKASMSQDKSETNFRMFKGQAVAVGVGNRLRCTWMRGLLHDVREKRVEIVDTGGGRSFNQNCIRRLDPKYLSLPRLSIKCSLTDNEPYTASTLARFKDDYIDCRFLAHFKKKISQNYYLIVLLHYESITAFDMLKIFIDKPVDFVKSRVVDINDEVHEVKLLSLPTESETHFYIRLTSEEQSAKRLLSDLSEYYQKVKMEKLAVNKLKASNVYVCEHNGKWFRGQYDPLLEEQETHRFFLLDEGSFTTVSLSRVRLLLDCYSCPGYAIRCCFDENGNWPINIEKKKFVVFKMKFIGLIGNCNLISAVTDSSSASKNVEKISLIDKIESLISDAVPDYILTPNDLLSAESTIEMSIKHKIASSHDAISSSMNAKSEISSVNFSTLKTNVQSLSHAFELRKSDEVDVTESKTVIEPSVLDNSLSQNILLIEDSDETEIQTVQLVDLSIPSEESKLTNNLTDLENDVAVNDLLQDPLFTTNPLEAYDAMIIEENGVQSLSEISQSTCPESVERFEEKVGFKGQDTGYVVQEYVSLMIKDILDEVCAKIPA